MSKIKAYYIIDGQEYVEKQLSELNIVTRVLEYPHLAYSKVEFFVPMQTLADETEPEHYCERLAVRNPRQPCELAWPCLQPACQGWRLQ